MGRRRTSCNSQPQTKGDDMRRNLKSLLAASALLAGLVAAPALYAQDEPASPQPPMAGQGMMGQGGMMQGGRGMMGQGGMMQGGQGMMNMMGQMSEMMRSEEHTSELQSLMRITYAVFCLKKKTHETRMSDHQ